MAFDSLCFSIATDQRTLDLRGEDENVCKKWFNALKSISKRNFTIKELNSKDFKKDLKNREIFLGDIWKTEIIPNWATYRELISDGFNSGENINRKKHKY